MLFSSNDILPLTDVVFNTEAHVFPRFQLGKLFTTGWERKRRDADGHTLPETKQEAVTKAAPATQPATPVMQTVVVTQKDEKGTPTDLAVDAGKAALPAETPALGGMDPITGKEKGGS